MATPNPFRSRHSDTPGEYAQFARTFAPQVLDVLPPLPWTKLLVIRSAPGAGKTSLMKALSAETLSWISHNETRVKPTYDTLASFGAIVADRPHLLGVRISLKYDFLSLADVGGPPDHQQRLLNRLLDARIMSGLIRAALLVGGKNPNEAATLRVEADPDNTRAQVALNRLGGTNGLDLQQSCETSENLILDLLDRLIARGQELPNGHQHIYSVQALSGSRLIVDDTVLNVLPVIMLDEGQNIADRQRERLISELSDRETTVARWLGMQSRAMSDDELIGAGQQGRDYEKIELEWFSRDRVTKPDASSPIQRMTPTHYRRMLLEIADKRGTPALERLVDGGWPFTQHFVTDGDEELANNYTAAAQTLREDIEDQVRGTPRYQQWLEHCDLAEGKEAVAQLAALEVLIARDRNRAQQDLFDDFVLPTEELQRRGDSSLREAALLRASHRLKLPYYYGGDAMTRLASSNVEQFLELCGDMYALMQIRASTNKRVELDAASQDKIIRSASDRYWNNLRLLPDGHLIQNFVAKIADLAAVEAAKPTIPYPPGVTGTALTMTDRQRLVDSQQRKSYPGSNDLLRAISSAIAHNVVWIEPDYKVKGDVYLVIYLNRLLCPRFRMPLTLGSFREKPLRVLSHWFTDSKGTQVALL